ncbi:MAG: hypothetical protein ACYDHZ_11295, partial [Dehalococcoidia bacterium]
SANVKVAIYADSGGTPGSLITTNNSSTPVVSGWNTIAITSTPVTSGTTYWLAFNSDQTVVNRNAGAANQWYWKTMPFSNSFPDPAGSGFSITPHYTLMAGWGNP